MDKATVIALAREAAFHTPVQEAELLRFAALVIANNPPQSWMSYQEGYEAGQQAGRLAEREECANIALNGTGEAVQLKTLEIIRAERERIADAIRSRT